MRRLLVFLVLALPLRAEDDPAKTVAGLAAQLGQDDVEKRDAALNALVKLGVKAESAVKDELARATDPEVQGRLRAVLQMYALAGEESWALERIRRNDLFPPSKEGFAEISLSGPASVAGLLDRLREQSGVKIECFAGDPFLETRLEATPFSGSRFSARMPIRGSGPRSWRPSGSPPGASRAARTRTSSWTASPTLSRS